MAQQGYHVDGCMHDHHYEYEEIGEGETEVNIANVQPAGFGQITGGCCVTCARGAACN